MHDTETYFNRNLGLRGWSDRISQPICEQIVLLWVNVLTIMQNEVKQYFQKNV